MRHAHCWRNPRWSGVQFAWRWQRELPDMGGGKGRTGRGEPTWPRRCGWRRESAGRPESTPWRRREARAPRWSEHPAHPHRGKLPVPAPACRPCRRRRGRAGTPDRCHGCNPQSRRENLRRRRLGILDSLPVQASPGRFAACRHLEPGLRGYGTRLHATDGLLAVFDEASSRRGLPPILRDDRDHCRIIWMRQGREAPGMAGWTPADGLRLLATVPAGAARIRLAGPADYSAGSSAQA